jgi:hypothetical protein
MLAVSWGTIRLFLHVLAATVWVGGQLTLAALVPVLRRLGAEIPRTAAPPVQPGRLARVRGPDRHRRTSEKGFADDVLSFVLGVASNGAWAGLIHLLRRNHAKSVVKGKVIRCVQAADGTTAWEWFEVEGTGEEVAKAFESMREAPRTRSFPRESAARVPRASHIWHTGERAWRSCRRW